MVDAGKDEAPVALIAAGQEHKINTSSDVEIEYLPAIQILNDRGDFSATMGTLPPWSRGYIKGLPWFANGQRAVSKLACVSLIR